MRTNMQNNLKTIEDWESFMQDVSIFFEVPIDTLNRLALLFVCQEFYGYSMQHEHKQVGTRTTLRNLREHLIQKSFNAS